MFVGEFWVVEATRRMVSNGHLFTLRVQDFLERDAKLLAYGLKFLEILLVLALVLDLVFDA